MPRWNRIAFYLFLPIYITAACYFFSKYFSLYFKEFPLYAWSDFDCWQFGPGPAFEYVKTVRHLYDEVIFCPQGIIMNAPEMLVTFYMPGDQGCRVGDFRLFNPSRKQLFILKPSRLGYLSREDYQIHKEIFAPNGELAWVIVSFKNAPLDKEEAGTLIADDEGLRFEVIRGKWPSGFDDGCFGAINHGAIRADGVAEARWKLKVPKDGDYEVFARWSRGQSGIRATNTPYTIRHTDGATTVRVNQQQQGGKWNSLGVYRFSKDEPAIITITNDANQWVLADAVKLEYREKPDS
jgi:hypothetical protein